MSDETTPQDSAAMSPASAGSVAGEPTTQAAFHRWQEFCKSCGFRLYDTPEAMSAFLEGIRFGRATSLTGAEREAVEVAISREMDAEYYGGDEPPRVVLLRGLLARQE